MSPVSRGRKTKNRKKKKNPKRAVGRPGGDAVVPVTPFGPPRSALSALLDAFGGPRQRPDWFDESIGGVLDRAGVLASARDPRQLEQAAAELLGAELYGHLQAERSGLWLEWWFEELAAAAATRANDLLARALAGSGGGTGDSGDSGGDSGDGGDSGTGGWDGCWRLLHALTALGSPALAHSAQENLDQVTGALPADVLAAQPAWLRPLPKLTATGELWWMGDVYGGRQAVLAGYQRPDGAESSVYLFDVNTCGFAALASAGVFDDVAQGAAAWRALVGDAADDAQPARVDAPETLHCLVYWDHGEEMYQGDESRSVMDNVFRARRRLHDLVDALAERGTRLPPHINRYRDLDTAPAVEAFTAWYEGRHGTAPETVEVVEVLAHEWLSGSVPGTEHVVAPERLSFFRSLVEDDWIPEDPITIGVVALLPEWVRWNGEQTGLPAHRLDPVVALAAEPIWDPTEE